MSSDASSVMTAARQLIGDTNPFDFATGSRKFYRIIEGELQRVAEQLDLGPAWSNSVLTLNPAAVPADYTLPTGVLSQTTVQYQSIYDLRRGSDKFILHRKSPEQIDAMRQGVSPAVSATYVESYSLTPDTDANGYAKVTVAFWPQPTTADTIDVLQAPVPTRFITSGIIDDLAASPIPFDEPLVEGFIQGCAASAIRSMTVQRREQFGITAEYQASLEARYAEAVQRARLRLIRFKLSSGKPTGGAVYALPDGWF